MGSDFQPPSIDRLTEVDTAECQYSPNVIEIEGVVSPSNQGGWFHPDNYGVHCFNFSAWRRPGHPLAKTKLTVLRPVDRDGDWFSEFSELTIQRIHILLSTDETRAIFASKSEGSVDSEDLLAVVAELKKPVIVTTDQFGDLTLDRLSERFEGNVQWNGESISVTFDVDQNEDITNGLVVAKKLWDDARAWKEKVDNYAVKELLLLKNENWLGDDETPLSAEQFKSRMTLQSISIDPNGAFEFWHDDGDLFWGHSIQVSGSISEGLRDADIPG